MAEGLGIIFESDMLVAFKFAQSMEKVGVLRLDVDLGGEIWERRSWVLLLASLAVWYRGL